MPSMVMSLNVTVLPLASTMIMALSVKLSSRVSFPLPDAVRVRLLLIVNVSVKLIGSVIVIVAPSAALLMSFFSVAKAVSSAMTVRLFCGNSITTSVSVSMIDNIRFFIFLSPLFVGFTFTVKSFVITLS